MQDNPQYPGTNVVYEIVREAFARQVDSIDSIDTKANIILGFTGVVLSIIFGSNLVNPFNLEACWQKILFYFSLLFIFLSAVFSMWAYKIREFKTAPEPRKAYDNVDNSKKQLKLIIAAAIVKSYEANEKKIENKRRFVGLAVGSLFLGLAILFVVFSHYIYLGG